MLVMLGVLKARIEAEAIVLAAIGAAMRWHSAVTR
jgi:hypothetical protein